MRTTAQTPPAHTLPTLLAKNPSLSLLVAEAARQQQCLACVLACLPEDWRPHCTAARITEEDTLVLFVDQAAWANRLRYQSVRLCRAVSTEARTVRHLRVRILVDFARPTARKLPLAVSARLTPQQIEQWRSAVDLPGKRQRE